MSGNPTNQALTVWPNSPFTGEVVGSKQTPQKRNMNRVIAISLPPCGANQRTASLLPLDGINLRRALIASNKRSAIESNAEKYKSLQRLVSKSERRHTVWHLRYGFQFPSRGAVALHLSLASDEIKCAGIASPSGTV